MTRHESETTMFRDEKLSTTESLTCIANNIIENLQMYLIYFIYLFFFFDDEKRMRINFS